MRGRKPRPTAIRRASGNPGKRGYNHAEPVPPAELPHCPPHLSEAAQEEWHRLAGTLHDMGVLTTVDRAALAAYCQAYGRWAEAEEKLKETPVMLKTPSGYVQQSPWLLQDRGVTSLRALANALNAAGMQTRRGGRWHVSSVRNLLMRLEQGP